MTDLEDTTLGNEAYVRTMSSDLENVLDNNKYMGGMDKNDQLHGYYSVCKKSRKSYKYLFWFLFETPHQ